jgi:hypothetical protein
LIEQLLTGFGSATAAGLNAYIPMLMLVVAAVPAWAAVKLLRGRRRRTG